MSLLSATDVEKAAERLAPHVLRTPLMRSRALSMATDVEVFLKLESEQLTGSFKLRGAYNKVISVRGAAGTTAPVEQRFVTASSGNHALALVTALETLGLQGTVVLPIYADASKLASLQAFEKSNIKVVNHGTDCVHSEAYARELETKDKNNVYVSPYNDEDVVAGQGSVAVEMVQQADKPLDAVFVTVGGGGLISGISIYLKANWPDCKIIGCQPQNSAVMYESVKKGQIIPEEEIDQEKTLSDGSEGGVEAGAITFGFCKRNVDEWVLVSEDEIGAAMAKMLKLHKKVIEGAAGVALAAFLKTADQYKGKRVGVVLCGSNVNPDVLFTQYTSFANAQD